MKLSVKVEGLELVRKNIAALAKKYPEALGAALYMEGMDIWRDSVKRAPVEFGVLRASAYVSPPTGAGMEVEAGFGTKYAIPQHERTEYRHPRGGEAKYLERTVHDRLNGMLERLNTRTKRNVERGVGARAIPAVAPSRPKGG